MRKLICCTLLFAFTAAPAVAYDGYGLGIDIPPRNVLEEQRRQRESYLHELQIQQLQRQQRAYEEQQRQQQRWAPGNPHYERAYPRKYYPYMYD